MQTKTRLGSRSKAMIAYRIAYELNLFDVEEDFDQDSNGRWIKLDNSFDINEYPGWRFVGIGSTRLALMYDNVVYKLNIANCQENSHEYEKYSLLKEHLVDGWIGSAFRVAECELYSFKVRGKDVNVIAMEYISGEHASPDEATDVDYLISRLKLGIEDIYSGNVRYDLDGNLVLIDFSQ